jgi:hypothetical protein
VVGVVAMSEWSDILLVSLSWSMLILVVFIHQLRSSSVHRVFALFSSWALYYLRFVAPDKYVRFKIIFALDYTNLNVQHVGLTQTYSPSWAYSN